MGSSPLHTSALLSEPPAGSRNVSPNALMEKKKKRMLIQGKQFQAGAHLRSHHQGKEIVQLKPGAAIFFPSGSSWSKARLTPCPARGSQSHRCPPSFAGSWVPATGALLWVGECHVRGLATSIYQGRGCVPRRMAQIGPGSVLGPDPELHLPAEHPKDPLSSSYPVPQAATAEISSLSTPKSAKKQRYFPSSSKIHLPMSLKDAGRHHTDISALGWGQQQGAPSFLPLHAGHQPLRELPQAVERWPGSQALLVPVRDGNPGWEAHGRKTSGRKEAAARLRLPGNLSGSGLYPAEAPWLPQREFGSSCTAQRMDPIHLQQSSPTAPADAKFRGNCGFFFFFARVSKLCSHAASFPSASRSCWEVTGQQAARLSSGRGVCCHCCHVFILTLQIFSLP